MKAMSSSGETNPSLPTSAAECTPSAPRWIIRPLSPIPRGPSLSLSFSTKHLASQVSSPDFSFTDTEKLQFISEYHSALISDLIHRHGVLHPLQVSAFHQLLGQSHANQSHVRLDEELHTNQTNINTLLNKEPLLDEATKQVVRLEIAVEECQTTMEQCDNSWLALQPTMDILRRVSPRSALSTEEDMK
ncbi:hypothetical protein ACHAP5_010478 [Fusarium lateritium]